MKENCKINAVIITFNPEIERLYLNIQAVSKQVGRLFVYDNNSENINDIQEIIKKEHNVELIKSEQNIGISAALNNIINMLSNSETAWLLALDQDSIISDNAIQDFFPYTKLDRVGIICPYVYDKRRKNENMSILRSKYDEIDFCITSGSLINISICKILGLFDEWLFIGLVDNEYCYRLIKNNYRIIRVNSVILDHELGNLTPSKMEKVYLKLGDILRCDTIKKLSYHREVSAFRLYYATRNMIYLNKKYEKFSDNKWTNKFIIKNSISNVLRGKNKFKLIKALISAKYDAMKKIEKM